MTLLFIVLIFLILDWFMTFVYCALRKRKGMKQGTNSSETKGRQPVTIKKRMVSELVKYIEGFILYQCVISQYIPSQRIRKFILKYQYCMNLHPSCTIYHGCEFRHPWNITIGEGSSIGDHAKIDGRNGVIIGSNANFGSGVWIWSEQHDYNDAEFSCNEKGGKVEIGDRVWISARAIVLPGVTVHDGAVIGAGAIVTKDCEEFALYVGCPAVKKGNRNRNLTYELADQYLHFY